MKRKSLIKNILLLSLVLVAAMIGLICFFTIALIAWKELIALIVCITVLLIFGKANAW